MGPQNSLGRKGRGKFKGGRLYLQRKNLRFILGFRSNQLFSIS